MGAVAGEIGHGIVVEERCPRLGSMAFTAFLAQLQPVRIVPTMTIDAARLARFVFAARMTGRTLDARVFALQRKVRHLGVVDGGLLELDIDRVTPLAILAQLTAVAIVMTINTLDFAAAVIAALVTGATFLPRVKARQREPGIAIVVEVEFFRAALGVAISACLVLELSLVGVFVAMTITAPHRQLFEFGRPLAAMALAAP